MRPEYEHLRKKAGKCPGYVYCLIDSHNGICRIGKTEKPDGKRQLSQMQYYPFDLGIITIKVNYYSDTETFLHRKFKDKKLKADWYRILPSDFVDGVDEYKIICRKEIKAGIHISQTPGRKYDNRYIPIIPDDPTKKIRFKKIGT